MGRQKTPDLYRAPFPLYTVRVHRDTGLVITAGGGGAVKTGIKNGVHFLRLECVEGQVTASLAHSFDTDTHPTMNMELGADVIAAGQDANCCLLRFKEVTSKEEPNKEAPAKKGAANNQGPRRRKPGGSHSGAAESNGGKILKNNTTRIAVEKLQEVQTDFSTEGLQKALRFSSDLSLLVTGGADGHIRVWEYPTMTKKLDFKAHEGEIEDLDISPNKKELVTVGRDFTCYVWKNDQLVTGLHWNENFPGIPDKMYRYQACRFGRVEDNKEALRLYTIQVPNKRDRKPPPCYITKWDGRTFLPLLTQPCGNEVISCLAISDYGTFLGLGTVTGSVAIYISFSLQRLYYVKEAHGIVVTDLAFIPETKSSRQLIGENEAVMLSVAVDSRCKLHSLPNRRSFPVWFVLLICALMIVASVLFLQYAFPGFI
ncbi:prolactin regulatory element-binding protein [Erpetoichthys calabaricus]|uniref:Prolactin regulatory element binding n=1 Tax=Erpetoichthys calabaricus TaxID=27687 RepID=A0A8C4RUJ5_ERPCA|nr:prolactin regulatory element-binding protein [Erpetoichthys calabaricus]XP_028653037.1 prolactin regulatory element-binding protein [Erpetoichthys calabaricus]